MASCFSAGKVVENLRFIEQIGLQDMYAAEQQTQLLSRTLFLVSVPLIYVSQYKKHFRNGGACMHVCILAHKYISTMCVLCCVQNNMNVHHSCVFMFVL